MQSTKQVVWEFVSSGSWRTRNIWLTQCPYGCLSGRKMVGFVKMEHRWLTKSTFSFLIGQWEEIGTWRSTFSISKHILVIRLMVWPIIWRKRVRLNITIGISINVENYALFINKANLLSRIQIDKNIFFKLLSQSSVSSIVPLPSLEKMCMCTNAFETSCISKSKTIDS